MITKNEQSKIERTLRSVHNLATELIVVDSGSTDDTCHIAQRYGAKVYSEEWKGFGRQKNSALGKCRGPWILCLDADEEVTPQLEADIRAHVAKGVPQPALINRRTEYLGRLLKYGWQPDLKLLLVHTDLAPQWSESIVHESMNCQGTPVTMRGEIVHRPYRSIQEHFEKTIRYAALMGESNVERGRQFSLVSALVSSLASFAKWTLVRMAWRDGIPGIIMIFSAVVYTMLKYFFLWENKSKRGKRA